MINQEIQVPGMDRQSMEREGGASADGQSGYNKRIRKAFWLFARVIRRLAMDTTAKRSNVAGWAEYGYCASHSRFF